MLEILIKEYYEKKLSILTYIMNRYYSVKRVYPKLDISIIPMNDNDTMLILKDNNNKIKINIENEEISFESNTTGFNQYLSLLEEIEIDVFIHKELLIPIKNNILINKEYCIKMIEYYINNNLSFKNNNLVYHELENRILIMNEVSVLLFDIKIIEDSNEIVIEKYDKKFISKTFKNFTNYFNNILKEYENGTF